jgi:adenylate cyclase, class 2
MKKNLELKVKVNDLKNFEDILLNLNLKKQILKQTDTYYNVTKGRAKLREEENNVYFIFYERPNIENAKESQYYTFEVKDVQNFKTCFKKMHEEEIQIKKERILFLYKNARIHLDTVQSLGCFIEIEVVIKNIEEENNSKLLLNEISKLLKLENEEKISDGYRELLLKLNILNY